MNASRTMTLATLERLGACSDQREEFKRRFGSSIEVTEELCLSVSDVFAWDWIAQRVLSAPALAEYRRVRAPARAEYERVRAPARAEYERVRAATFARLYVSGA